MMHFLYSPDTETVLKIILLLNPFSLSCAPLQKKLNITAVVWNEYLGIQNHVVCKWTDVSVTS
jgi:hypothetical protein